MLHRLLIASVCVSVLGVVAPATAETHTATRAERATAVAAVKEVVRQYGAGSVLLQEGQQLVLRFRGERGDRVSLGTAYRTRSANPYYGTLEKSDVRVQGRHSEPKPNDAGYFRLPEDGWFNVYYLSDYRQRVQLFKQVRVSHRGRGTTPLPERRGYQYAVTVRAPASGLEVVSFGTRLSGVLSHGRYAYDVPGEVLVLAPGLPVLGNNPVQTLTDELAPRQRVLALVDPSSSGLVTTAVPNKVGRVPLDGASIALPAGTQAVVAEITATDLAVSAQRLLNVRILGTRAKGDWGVLVLPEAGGPAEPSAAAYIGLHGLAGTPLYQLATTTGTYRVLVYPTSRKAPAGKFELDSVAAGGTIAVDGPTVSVPARPDGRYTLLNISQSSGAVPSYLYVPTVTVPGLWGVYAGRLVMPDCAGGSSGCGEDNGASVTSADTTTTPSRLWGGYVLTMPADDQTTGSFNIRLSSTYSP